MREVEGCGTELVTCMPYMVTNLQRYDARKNEQRGAHCHADTAALDGGSGSACWSEEAAWSRLAPSPTGIDTLWLRSNSGDTLPSLTALLATPPPQFVVLVKYGCHGKRYQTGEASDTRHL